MDLRRRPPSQEQLLQQQQLRRQQRQAAELEAKHHVLIQALMGRGPHEEARVDEMVRELSGAHDTSTSDFVGQCNRALVRLQLELRAGADQYDGKVWYAFVNKSADEQGKLGSNYSHAQIQLFKAIMERVALNADGKGEMSSMELHHPSLLSAAESQQDAERESQAAAHRQLTGAEKDKTVEQLAAEGWLRKSPDGRSIGLGVRSYLELRHYLKSMDGMPLCDVCNDAAVKALVCSTPDCDFRIHRHCEARKFEGTAEPKCPLCEASWPYIPRQQQAPAVAAAGRGGARGGSRVSVKEEKMERRKRAAAPAAAGRESRGKGARGDD